MYYIINTLYSKKKIGQILSFFNNYLAVYLSTQKERIAKKIGLRNSSHRANKQPCQNLLETSKYEIIIIIANRGAKINESTHHPDLPAILNQI